MSGQKIRMAQVGYGMFGSDVVAGTLWDLQRNGISPSLGRVGLDDFARDYAEVTFELMAIGTRTLASAQRAAEENELRTGRRPRTYYGATPWIDLLNDFPDLDILVVATPDHLHTAPILAALERGVHVITEKPMCLRLDEADRIIAMARDHGLIVGVDMHKRYDPDHLKIFQELQAELGTPIYARGVLEEPLEVSTSIFQWAEQSDPFTYVGIHWVDLFMHYLRLEPLSLFGVGQKKRLKNEFGKEAFDAVQVMVQHTNGLNILYENNWITPADFEGPVNQESGFVGAHGKVESDSQYRGLRYWIENKGSRTSNTHFFRWVRRPDGSLACTGYGKDSLVDCFEKVCRIKFLGATAAELAGTYPDALSQRGPIAVLHAAWEVVRRNERYLAAGQGAVVTARFDAAGILLYDPFDGGEVRLYPRESPSR